MRFESWMYWHGVCQQAVAARRMGVVLWVILVLGLISFVVAFRGDGSWSGRRWEDDDEDDDDEEEEGEGSAVREEKR